MEFYTTVLWSREGNDEWYGEKDRKNNGGYAESPFLWTHNSIMLVNTTFVQSRVTVSWNKGSPEEWSPILYTYTYNRIIFKLSMLMLKRTRKKKEKRKTSEIQTRATRLVKFPNIKCLLTWETGFPSSVTHLTQIFDRRETSDSDVNAVTPKHVRHSCYILYHRNSSFEDFDNFIIGGGEGGGIRGAASVLEREEGEVVVEVNKNVNGAFSRAIRATNVRSSILIT